MAQEERLVTLVGPLHSLVFEAAALLSGKQDCIYMHQDCLVNHTCADSQKHLVPQVTSRTVSSAQMS